MKRHSPVAMGPQPNTNGARLFLGSPCRAFGICWTLLAVVSFVLTAPSQTPGTQLWEFSTGKPISSSPAIGSDGTIYLCTGTIPYDGSKLFALDPGGVEKWHYEVGGVSFASPIVAGDGTIYVGVYGQMYAFSPQGALKWNQNLASPDFSFIGLGSDKNLRAICGFNFWMLTQDGGEMWRMVLGNPVRSPLAIGIDATVWLGDYVAYSVTGKTARDLALAPVYELFQACLGSSC